MILLVNPNSNQDTTNAMCALVAPVLAQVQGWTAPEGPQVIKTSAELDAAAWQVVAIQPPATCRGVIVAAFGDPGVCELAARLSVPVIGIGKAAALAASRGGRRFAVATTTPALVDRISCLMKAHSSDGYLGCFLTDGQMEALLQSPPALDEALLKAVAHAAESGADTVIIGGGPLAQAARRLAPLSPVPLIEPLLEAARLVLNSCGRQDN